MADSRALLVRWLVPLTLAAPLAALTPAAQERRSDDGSASASDAADARPRERILHFADGRKVRARSRRSAGVWEIERGDAWVALQPGAVERARAVSEVEAEARERERMLRLHEIEPRLEYARWLGSEGLGTECLRQLDLVLDDAPDHADALALLASSDVRIALPSLEVAADGLDAAVDRFLARTTRLGRSGRELAVRELGAAAAEHGYDLGTKLEELLAHPSPKRRAFAALALRRLFPGAALEPLLQRAVLDPDEAARAESARALGDVGQEVVALPVIRALGSTSSTVRTHAAQALGHMGYPAAVPALIAALNAPQAGASGVAAPRSHIYVGNELAYVADYDVEIAQGASIADPIVARVQEAVVLDARVIGMQLYELRKEYASMGRALEQLTGVRAGDQVKDWNRWWEENRARYEPGEGAAEE